jgi:hypothetical protein
MIGRTNGQYLPGDPSFYRRRRGWETYLEIFMIATHFDLKPVPARWAIHLGEKTTMQNGLSTRIILIRGIILSDLALGQHQIETNKNIISLTIDLSQIRYISLMKQSLRWQS